MKQLFRDSFAILHKMIFLQQLYHLWWINFFAIKFSIEYVYIYTTYSHCFQWLDIFVMNPNYILCQIAWKSTKYCMTFCIHDFALMLIDLDSMYFSITMIY